jgi:MmeI, DNA-methyltransferase domain/MmeI, target recognition domain/MmeI, N-terminal domain/MmeI, helicase spacer domain/MmeI, C-terminal domain
MRLSWIEIRNRAVKFAREWKDAHYEKGETQSFYNDFFDVFGVPRRKVAMFEEPVKRPGSKAPGFIDLFWKGTLLVEQKSAGGSLTKAREQAFDYFPGIKDSDLPRYLLVSDFQTFELTDLETRRVVRFRLSDFSEYVERFSFIVGGAPAEFKDQDPVNIDASELMGHLHDALLASGYRGHDLERFLVRLVFCLFADNTRIFDPKRIFHDFIDQRTSEDGSDLGPRLEQLFYVLNQPEAERPRTLDDDLKQFPYINGLLFAERLAMPAFDSEMRNLLLAACGFDWSKISPAIFGALFQSVMDKQKRRAIGAHYTTERNILKVIQPLFLDELRAEFARLKTRRDTGRAKALELFRDKLAGIRYLDPACGCGNFLVIAYRELRDLETQVLVELNKSGQLDLRATDLSKLDVNQFFGIEIEEFPARIAEVALWMMDHIMNIRLGDALGQIQLRIPLRVSPTITNADALEIDWRKVIPPAQCRYILGNPPFGGSKFQTPEHRARISELANLKTKSGSLDYVAGWFLKAADYIQGTNAEIGFVATNSITQGEQVAELWPVLFDRYHLEIAFAHRTFEWGSEAKGKAHVHVVVIGLTLKTQQPAEKRLFDYPDIASDPIETRVTAISPYLFDAGRLADPHTIIQETSRPPLAMPAMIIGSKPIDGGNYIFTDEEKEKFLAHEPQAEGYMRPFIGSEEFINGGRRWILALHDASPSDLRAMPHVLERVEAVRKFRRASKSAPTRQLADFPTRYHVNVIPKGSFLVVPEVSSERREYVPIGYLSPPTIPSNLVHVVDNGSLALFALLTSRIHMAWLRFIGGRLESRYRYSIGLVYNPFPWPALSPEQHEHLNDLANEILIARKKYAKETMADLYDSTAMPPELRKAHQVLDVAVDKIFRKEPFGSDRERVEFLLSLYEKQQAPVVAASKQKPRRRPRVSARWASP